jgi:hypothetical protein
LCRRTPWIWRRLQDPVYVGLGVCSLDANTLETAVFSNVKVVALAPKQIEEAR